MIYHSFIEFISAIILSLMYGIITAGIYISQDALLFWLIRFIKIPIITFKNEKAFVNKTQKNSLRLRHHIADFIFFTLFGVGYIIIQYIALDGAFRIFFLLIFLFGFYASWRWVGKLIKIIIDLAFKFLYGIALRVFKIFTFPLKMLIKILSYLFCPLGRVMKGWINTYRIRQISRKNTKILKNIVKKI